MVKCRVSKYIFNNYRPDIPRGDKCLICCLSVKPRFQWHLISELSVYIFSISNQGSPHPTLCTYGIKDCAAWINPNQTDNTVICNTIPSEHTAK